jgi:hypothetical protein
VSKNECVLPEERRTASRGAKPYRGAAGRMEV